MTKRSGAEEEVMTLADLNRATLARQMLLKREKVGVLDAVGRLLSIQAQWPKPPFVALWSRLGKFERADLAKLVRENRIVRGTAWRATIFVMTAKDYATFRASFQTMLDRVAKT